MTGLITLREPVVTTPVPTPEEPTVPLEDENGHPLDWTLRQVNGLRFARWRAQHGEFDDDIVGGTPEPLPPIVREVAR